MCTTAAGVQVRQHQSEHGRDAGAAEASAADDDSALPAHERYFNAVHSTACAPPPPPDMRAA